MKRSGRGLFASFASVVALTAGLIAVVPTSAAAATLPVITVHESDHGFTTIGSLNRHAGRVTFRFITSTTDSNNGSEVDLVTLKHGKTLAQLLAAIPGEEAMTPSVAAAATRSIVASAQILGGAGLYLPSQTSRVTETLYSGTYYLIDVAAALAGDKKPQVVALHVHGSPNASDPWPGTAATILVGNGSTDRFAAPVLPAGKNYLIRNNGDTIHFVQFMPVKHGTTDAEIQADLTSSNQSGPGPFLGPGLSTGVISPGKQIVFSSASLEPGTYVLVCFVADAETGMPHAFMGMHLVVTIR